MAAVDWPKGKPVRVVSVDTRQLGVVVKRERDWFRLHGRAVVDENIVLDFETLMAAAQRAQPIRADGRRRLRRAHAFAQSEDSPISRRSPKPIATARAFRNSRPHGSTKCWRMRTSSRTASSAPRSIACTARRTKRPPCPKALQAELRAYQEDGYRWAMRLAQRGLGGCLADDMGFGKTLQGLAVLLARGDDGAALVIAPTSVCGNWLAEARRFAPTLNVVDLRRRRARRDWSTNAGPMDVIVVSYTLLQQAQERFAARSWHTVIADEAQAIKNAAAKRSLAVFDLDADFRLALSGTPVENRLAELWSIMRFVNPGLLGTLTRFTERFATPIERDRDRDAQHLLKRLIGPFVLRRTKAQVLQELPPRTELDIAVAPAADEAAHYEALRRQARGERRPRAVDRTRGPGAAQHPRAAHAAAPRGVRSAAGEPGARHRGRQSAGVRRSRGRARGERSQGARVQPVRRFPASCCASRSTRRASAYQYLDGATPAAERTRRVAAFQAGQGDLFLISLKAGGFGLNLTAADYVLITDPWWNPAAEDQAMGRAHRIGQTRPVTVYRLVTKGTVEERIVELHQDKRALAESILAEGDAALLPSADDLIALIRGG